jgi:hypothetical protein
MTCPGPLGIALNGTEMIGCRERLVSSNRIVSRADIAHVFDHVASLGDARRCRFDDVREFPATTSRADSQELTFRICASMDTSDLSL